jgi:hypothetical protein
VGLLGDLQLPQDYCHWQNYQKASSAFLTAAIWAAGVACWSHSQQWKKKKKVMCVPFK